MAIVDDAGTGTPPGELLQHLSPDWETAPWGIPCVARPGTGLVHLDGPCGCFFGGPAPVFATAPPLR